VGDHIRARRLDLGLFQREVAERIGVSEATVYGWEKLGYSPSMRHWPGILAFLQYEHRSVLGWSGTPPSDSVRREG
jgi:DNA-binding XRE family transcriptional regulator